MPRHTGQQGEASAEVRFFSSNMNRSNEALHTLVHEAHDRYDILFIQEPWWGDIGRGQMASVKPGPGWRTLLPQRGMNAARPRVLAYYRGRRDCTVVPRYDLIDDADAMAVEVRRAGQQPVLYVNVYNQHETDADGRPTGRTTFQRVFADPPSPPIPRDAAVVMVGDFNEHHQWWQSMSGSARPEACELADWLRKHAFSLANKFDEPTFASHATGATSVLDLAFMNPAAARTDAMREFRVDPDATGASDHYGLLWTSAPSAAPVTNETGAQFNWKKADEEKFKLVLRARLDETGAVIRLILDPVYIPTREELERAAECYLAALVYAAEAAAPREHDG